MGPAVLGMLFAVGMQANALSAKADAAKLREAYESLSAPAKAAIDRRREQDQAKPSPRKP